LQAPLTTKALCPYESDGDRERCDEQKLTAHHRRLNNKPKDEKRYSFFYVKEVARRSQGCRGDGFSLTPYSGQAKTANGGLWGTTPSV
jgi:hypothetical protein